MWVFLSTSHETKLEVLIHVIFRPTIAALAEMCAVRDNHVSTANARLNATLAKPYAMDSAPTLLWMPTTVVPVEPSALPDKRARDRSAL